MVYFISSGDYIKIGFTSNPDISIRLKNLQTANPHTLKVVWMIPDGSLELEKYLLSGLSEYIVQGEWLCITPEELIPKVKKLETKFKGKLPNVDTHDVLWLSNYKFCKELTQNAKDVLLYIIVSSVSDKDHIELKIGDICKATGKRRVSVVNGVNNLIANKFIEPKSDNFYWVNPTLIYKGNRLAYYNENCPDCIEIVAEVSKSE